MRSSSIGALAAVLLSMPALGAPTASGAPAPADGPRSIPSPTAPGPAAPSALPPRHGPAPVDHYVDLNTATRNELMTLPGIGKAEADRIVAHRPYLVKTELVSKNVLPVGPFLSIKRLVVALPKSAARAGH